MNRESKNKGASGDGHFLTGRILLAMPGMGDPRFHHAVIFMCAHDKNGAMGIVVNHVLPGVDLAELIAQLNVVVEGGDRKKLASCPVLSGGPVESARGFILHSRDFHQQDTVGIDENFAVTGTIDALKSVASGAGPEKMLFALGYAGWGAGQLDQELQKNAWLVADADPTLVFDSNMDSKWDRAIKSLGIDPAMLSGAAGRA